MRAKVRVPTNGSFMILNASAENGRVVGRRAVSVSSEPGLMPSTGGNVERARQIVDDRIEQRLHALVLERRAAQHGHEREVQRALADQLLERGRVGSSPPDRLP
jgi:hypothetical protein